MSVNCPSSYIVLSCLRILQAWKGSMASLAVSEDGIPFGVGEDLFKSRRRKIVQLQEVRSQLRRRGFFLFLFAWLVFFPTTKIHGCIYRHHQMTPQGRMWESASCDASSNTRLFLRSPASPMPVLAKDPCGQTTRSVCGDSNDSRNFPTESRGREPHKGRARDDGRWYSINRLPKGRNGGGHPASLILILVRPDRPPPSTLSILPPLIPLHLSVFLSSSSSSPPQLAE